MTTPGRIRGVLFDFDGTLADTLPVCITAFRAAFLRHTGRNFTDAEIEALFGPSEEGAIQRVIPVGWEPAFATYLDEYRKAHHLCTAPIPGMRELLADLRAAGLKIGVVTGKGAESAAISLDLLGLRELLDTIETGEPQGNVKAEAIRRILDRWEMRPEEAVYVGDTASDVTISREVGLTPVGAAWSSIVHMDKLKASEPALLCHTAEELEAWLRERV